MLEWPMTVPTYNAERYPELVASGVLQEYGQPYVPVAVSEALGVRIVLGTNDRRTEGKPEIQIERRPGGWTIFLQAERGCGEVAYIHVLDDGRSFLQFERSVSPPLEILTCGEHVPESAPRTM